MQLGGTEDFDKAEAVPRSPGAKMNSLCHCKHLTRWCFSPSALLLAVWLLLSVEGEGKAKQPALVCPATFATFTAFLWMVSQISLLCSFPLTVDPSVCNNIDEQLQNALEHSVRPSVSGVICRR